MTKQNERLEWIGDSLLNFLVSKFLYEKFKDLNEGELTNKRKKLVSTPILAKAYGHQKNKSKKQLADMFEVKIAEIYFKKGYNAASKFVQENLIEKFEDEAEKLKDYKTLLQEKLQENGTVKIEYKYADKKCEIFLNGELLSVGNGKTRKAAEVDAARNAFKIVSKN